LSAPDLIPIASSALARAFVGGAPLARLTRIAIENSTNAPGTELVPTVTNVLVLSP
jgi:hypothetical protein